MAFLTLNFQNGGTAEITFFYVAILHWQGGGSGRTGVETVDKLDKLKDMRGIIL